MAQAAESTCKITDLLCLFCDNYYSLTIISSLHADLFLIRGTQPQRHSQRRWRYLECRQARHGTARAAHYQRRGGGAVALRAVRQLGQSHGRIQLNALHPPTSRACRPRPWSGC